MKILKGIFYGICMIVLGCCMGVLVCALNPSLTESLAAAVYGEETEDLQPQGEETLQSQSTGDTQPEDSQGLEPSAVKADYVIPSEEQVVLSDSVEGKSGYEPVREEREEVSQEEADAQEESPAVGETGEGLSFDTDIYPYYGMLTEDMQQVYRQIYANATALTASFAPVTEINVNELKNVFEAVYNDHPELFWLETGYTCKYLRTGQCVEILLQFNETTNYLAEARQNFEARAEEILTQARQLGSDSQKEQYVHDALVDFVEYDAGSDMNQSAYSALVNGRSVCAGYARTFQYLMQQLDIPCYYCTGYSGEDHAWNIVRLGQDYYNVDVTWDDTEPSTYDYYNKSDAEFASTHVRRGLSVYLPACNGTFSGDAAQESTASEDGQNQGQTDSQEAVQETEQPLINPNPQEPITWQSTWNNNRTEDTQGDSEEERLAEAGITADEVLDTMEEYYADCLAQMTALGSGQQQFTNVVPETLWASIERAYSDNSFRSQYVEEALNELGMQNFAIQLQAQRLGGGYYRLYHNISTWN